MVQIVGAPQQRESFGASLGRNLGGGLGEGITAGMQGMARRAQEERKFAQEMSLQKQKYEQEEGIKSRKFAEEFKADQENYGKIEKAFGKNFADVWMASPTGARTQLTQAALEAKARGIDLDSLLEHAGIGQQENSPTEMSANGFDQEQDGFDHMQEGVDQPEAPSTKPSAIFQELKTYLADRDKGLISSEKVARGKERFDTGLKKFEEAGTKLRSLTQDKRRLDTLDHLAKSKKLPKNLGRLNVDSDGNLRLPFASSTEAQRFVKTLTEFSSGAKDTYGSRVTNFDLQTYMRQFPTLLNSEEGRRQLIQQMKLVNQINSVYYKNLQKVYDEAGGVRNIDADVAERFAERMSAPMVDQLSSKFQEIGQFDSLPEASEFKGKRIKDKKTGEIFTSDGNSWVPSE